MEAQTPNPLSAQCQIHSGQPFTAVCQRCGTYMCAVCSEGGRHGVCAACRARGASTTFPFRRDSYTLGGLFEYAFRIFKQHWLTLVLANLLGFGSVIFVSILGSAMTLIFQDSPLVGALVQIVLFVPQIVLQGTVTLGTLHVAIRAARGEPVEIGHMFAMWRRLGAWFVQSMLTGLLFMPVVLVVGAVAAIVAFTGGTENPMAFALPMAIVGVLLVPVFAFVMLGLSFANMEIVAEPVGPVAGMHNSWSLARGKRVDIMLLALGTMAILFAGLLACGVGMLFAMPYATCVFASLYLALRNGAQDLRA